MHFKTIITTAFAALLATTTNAAAIGARSALIATDPWYACNCPNNCDYTTGHSCRFYAGPSDSSEVLSGTCVETAAGLTCVA